MSLFLSRTRIFVCTRVGRSAALSESIRACACLFLGTCFFTFAITRCRRCEGVSLQRQSGESERVTEGSGEELNSREKQRAQRKT